MITCCDRSELLAILCVMFSCVFVTFPYGVSGQVWYLIVSTPDLCFLLYFWKIAWIFTNYSETPEGLEMINFMRKVYGRQLAEESSNQFNVQ